MRTHRVFKSDFLNLWVVRCTQSYVKETINYIVICHIDDQYSKYVFASKGTHVMYLYLKLQLHSMNEFMLDKIIWEFDILAHVS